MPSKAEYVVFIFISFTQINMTALYLNYSYDNISVSIINNSYYVVLFLLILILFILYLLILVVSIIKEGSHKSYKDYIFVKSNFKYKKKTLFINYIFSTFKELSKEKILKYSLIFFVFQFIIRLLLLNILPDFDTFRISVISKNLLLILFLTIIVNVLFILFIGVLLRYINTRKISFEAEEFVIYKNLSKNLTIDYENIKNIDGKKGFYSKLITKNDCIYIPYGENLKQIISKKFVSFKLTED